MSVYKVIKGVSHITSAASQIQSIVWIPHYVRYALMNGDVVPTTKIHVLAGSEFGFRMTDLAKKLNMHLRYQDPYFVPKSQKFSFLNYKGYLMESVSENNQPDTPRGGFYDLMLWGHVDPEQFKKDVFENTKASNSLVVKTFKEEWKHKRKPFNPDKLPLPAELNQLCTSLSGRRNILLYGPPGTGKSTFSKHVALHHCRDLSLITNTDDFDEAINSLGLEDVVLLEDLDLLLENKGEIKHTLMQFLDGVLSNENQIIICTTNHIDKIPRELLRPGRFTDYVEVGNVTEEHLRNVCSALGLDYNSYRHCVDKLPISKALYGQEFTIGSEH